MQTQRILLQNRLIQLQNRRIQLQNRRIQLQTGRIQLQYRRIQLQTGRIQLQTGRIQLQRRQIQLQKPVTLPKCIRVLKYFKDKIFTGNSQNREIGKFSLINIYMVYCIAGILCSRYTDVCIRKKVTLTVRHT